MLHIITISLVVFRSIFSVSFVCMIPAYAWCLTLFDILLKYFHLHLLVLLPLVVSFNVLTIVN